MSRNINLKLQSALQVACDEIGVVYREVPADGRFHDTDIVDDRKGRGDGRIKLFSDGEGGIVFNWKGEQRVFFIGGDDRWMTAQERADRDRKRQKTIQAAEKDEAKRRTEAVVKARSIWKTATSATADHPYLLRKKISPVETLREIPVEDTTAVLGYPPKSKGEPLAGRLLIVPIKIGSTISTLEMIDEAGRKSAIAGGAKAGGYWATQPLPDGDGVGLTLLIGEGVATVLSGREATGHISVAALSCGNLEAVARTLRKRYPRAMLIVLADLGKGQKDAEEAARAVGACLAIPDFGDDRPEGMSDFNDLAICHGMDVVRRCIKSSVAPVATVTVAEWPEPQPLMSRATQELYPLDALPPIIRIAVEEVQNFTKAPIPLVASSALGALSLSVQAHVDMRRAEKLVGPVSLFLLSIADSGERKSTCDNFFTTALRDYQTQQAEVFKPAIKNHIAEIESWEAKRSGIKEKIRQLAKQGKPTYEQDKELRLLEHDKPEPPRVPELLLGDETPENLAWRLAKGWPSAGVITSEAGIVLGSHGMGRDSVMRNLSLLNVLWDGGTLSIGRRTSESFVVQDARLTVALQIQEVTLRSFFDRSGGLARGSGFLARFLISWPESTQGSRLFTEPPKDWPSLSAFNKRIAEILECPTRINEAGQLSQKSQLSLSQEAKGAWVSFHDAIEGELSTGGELYDVRDVASKTADNAARLAALFHVFEHGIDGTVGFEAIEGASRITAWHLNEARRFFGELAMPEDVSNAIRLDDWLIDYCKREKTKIIPRREIQRCVTPIRLREKAALSEALQELKDAGRIREVHENRRKEIYVNPMIFERGVA